MRAIALLESDGWFQVRTRGSHRQFHHRTKPGTVTVSGKPNVDISTGPLEQRVETSWLEEGGVIPMQYLVVLEEGPESFGAYVPDLPGCVAAGESREEALTLIREAIEFHIEGLKQDGQPIPPPSSSSEVVEIAAA